MSGRPRQRDAGAADGRRGRPVRPASGEPGRPDMEVTRANETMIRAVVVFVGGLRRKARHYPAAGRSGFGFQAVTRVSGCPRDFSWEEFELFRCNLLIL